MVIGRISWVFLMPEEFPDEDLASCTFLQSSTKCTTASLHAGTLDVLTVLPSC